MFHPHGDDFEIWNNSHNHPAHPVKVLYRYCYPTSNNWRNPIWSSIDHTPFPGIRKDMKEYPYYVAFIIWSPEETANGGWSEQVHHRTFGS